MEKPLLEKICKFENVNSKLKNGHRFKILTGEKNLIPKFLQFKLANRHLHNSVAYKKCQIKLLEEEIRAKREKNQQLGKEHKED